MRCKLALMKFEC